MIKLSICIATLNRGAFIGQTLDSIVSQITGEVEIVIVDGASTDNTEDVIMSYRQKHANLLYKRLDKKGGVDQDFSLAVELASGEYCWLFSDDDIIKPGAINSIIRYLNHDPGLLIVNAEIKNSDLSQLLKPNCLELNENTSYSVDDIDRLFQVTANYLSFIGCVVIRRSLWKDRDKKSYFGTLFVHMGVIFQRPIPEGVIVIAEPMISIRYGNAMWTEKAFEVSNFKWPKLVWSFDGITDLSKAKVCERKPWRNISRLLLYRARGLYNKIEYKKILENEITSVFFSICLYIVAILPIKFLNTMLTLYFKTLGANKANAKINLLDLSDGKNKYYKKI